MSENNNFIKNYHGLRGLAALMVFIAHSLGGYAAYIGKESEIISFIVNIGVFGVEIFFFLSGYVIYISCQRSSVKTFLKNRFFRIYPIFFVFTSIFFLANSFLSIAPEKQGVDLLLYNLLFLNLFFSTPALTPNAWSITYEIWFYLFSLLIFSGELWKGFRVLGIVLFGLFLLSFPISLYFILGMILSMVITSGKVNRVVANKYSDLLFILLTFILIYMAGSDRDYTDWEGVTNINQVLLMIILFLWMLFLNFNTGIISKILTNKSALYLGTVSYTLYLAHPYSYFISRTISGEVTSIYGVYVFILLNFLLTWSITVFVYTYVEKRMFLYFLNNTHKATNLNEK